MRLDVRQLSRPEEFEQVIDLQNQVWGLPPRDTMSPITLTALAQEYPRTGWVLGGFLKGRMVSFAVVLTTSEPDLVYGHMLGVLNQFRDNGVGTRLQGRVFALLESQGVRRICWTFEPLESRNAHVYLNKLGGRAIAYHRAHFYLGEGLAQGLPLDRFLYKLEFAERRDRSQELEPLGQALAAYPLAEPGQVPEAEAVLVETPWNFQALLAIDPDAARRLRADTRQVFEECLNRRGMVVDRLYSGQVEGQRRSFYRVRRS